jgi:hypothetical protein
MNPDFLGIGVPKAGTTWLHRILTVHPQIFVPARKEVHFFDRWYDRGEDWYRQVFAEAEGGGFRRVGEVTPHYVYGTHQLARVRAMPSLTRFIVLLRDPVERAHSHYWFRVRIENYRGSFEEFLAGRSEAIEWGRYAAHLAPWYDAYGRDAILPLIYERVFAEPESTFDRLAAFLDVDPAGFVAARTGAGEKVNPRFQPRHPRLYVAAVRFSKVLRRLDADRVLRAAKRLPILKLLEGKREAPSDADVLTPEIAARLGEIFAPDVARLESLIDTDLSLWRESWQRRAGTLTDAPPVKS